MANTPKVHQLKIDLASCKQGGLGVVKFYNKLVGIQSELKTMQKFHIVHVVIVSVGLETRS